MRMRIGLVVGVLLRTGKVLVTNVAVLPVSAMSENEERGVGGPLGGSDEDK